MPASLCGPSQDTSRLCKNFGATVPLERTYSDGPTLSQVQGLQIREAPAPSTLVLCALVTLGNPSTAPAEQESLCFWASRGKNCHEKWQVKSQSLTHHPPC